MEFQVPQFIEQKAKIIGPFSMGQFAYILGAAAISFIAYQIFELFLWVLISIVALAAAIALAFVKINGEPLPKIILFFLKFLTKEKKYTWQRIATTKTIEIDENLIYKTRKNMSFQEKLKSLSVKILGGKGDGESAKNKESKEKYQVVSYLTGEKEIAKRVDYK